MNKRDFMKNAVLFIPAAGALQALARMAEGEVVSAAEAATMGPEPGKPWYGMGIEVDKCIGCNKCVEACKTENNVPPEPFFFRTWIERYQVHRDGETTVECISLDPERGEETEPADPDVIRTYFVPKLCNQCANPPCVQVCPVGATFQTADGVVLVDEKRCLGCRYCIQACPYGARYLNPHTHIADKCTFCYHRITEGLQPACVEVCPTQARVFGDLNSNANRLVRFERMNKVSVLKPDMNTAPKVRYAQLDGEVR